MATLTQTPCSQSPRRRTAKPSPIRAPAAARSTSAAVRATSAIPAADAITTAASGAALPSPRDACRSCKCGTYGPAMECPASSAPTAAWCRTPLASPLRPPRPQSRRRTSRRSNCFGRRALQGAQSPQPSPVQCTTRTLPPTEVTVVRFATRHPACGHCLPGSTWFLPQWTTSTGAASVRPTTSVSPRPIATIPSRGPRVGPREMPGACEAQLPKYTGSAQRQTHGSPAEMSRLSFTFGCLDHASRRETTIGA